MTLMEHPTRQLIYLRSDIALTLSAGEADFLRVYIATVIDYYLLNTHNRL